MKVKNKPISTTSLGEIFQHVIKAVENLYAQHDYFKNLLKGNVKMKLGCKRLDLLIKCDDEKMCLYKTKKKKHFKKYKFKSHQFKGRKRMSYLKKNKFRNSGKSS